MKLRALFVAGVAALAMATSASAGSRSDVVQDGNRNTANVDQDDRNSADAQTIQTGPDNLANHRQRSRNNTSGCGQSGGGINECNIRQRSRN